MTARELDRIFRTILMGCVPGAAAAFALAQAEAEARGGAADAGPADAGPMVRWTPPPSLPSDSSVAGNEYRRIVFSRSRRVTPPADQLSMLGPKPSRAQCWNVCLHSDVTAHRTPEKPHALMRWDLVGCSVAADEKEEVVCEYEGRVNGGPAIQIGRRPAGLAVPTRPPPSLGVRLAEMAHLEAASVPAFRILGRDLTRLGAPRPLRDACAQALRDEIRHARTMRRLARRHGATVPRLRVAPVPARELADIAIENVVEGCVRETFGALLARHQAAHAAPEFRPVFAGIAADEARHAALAWRIDGWASPQLGRRGRRRVAEAREQAIEALAGNAPMPADDVLGLPTPAVADALLGACRKAVWA